MSFLLCLIAHCPGQWKKLYGFYNTTCSHNIETIYKIIAQNTVPQADVMLSLGPPQWKIPPVTCYHLYLALMRLEWWQFPQRTWHDQNFEAEVFSSDGPYGCLWLSGKVAYWHRHLYLLGVKIKPTEKRYTQTMQKKLSCNKAAMVDLQFWNC